MAGDDKIRLPVAAGELTAEYPPGGGPPRGHTIDIMVTVWLDPTKQGKMRPAKLRMTVNLYSLAMHLGCKLIQDMPKDSASLPARRVYVQWGEPLEDIINRTEDSDGTAR